MTTTLKIPPPKKPNPIYDEFISFIEEKELQDIPILTNIMTFKYETSTDEEKELEKFSELIALFSLEPLKSALEKDCLENNLMCYFDK